MKVTHLQLDETTRKLAGMRSSMRKRTLSEHVADLIKADAQAVGLSAFLADAEPSSGGVPEEKQP